MAAEVIGLTFFALLITQVTLPCEYLTLPCKYLTLPCKYLTLLVNT